MDKIKSDRERVEVEGLVGELSVVEDALRSLADEAEDQHATELQKWATGAVGMVHVFHDELEARLEEFEER